MKSERSLPLVVVVVALVAFMGGVAAPPRQAPAAPSGHAAETARRAAEGPGSLDRIGVFEENNSQNVKGYEATLKTAIDTWWSYNFSTGTASKLYEMTGSRMDNRRQFRNGKLLYLNSGVLYLFAFPDTTPLVIDKGGAFGANQLAFSPDERDVFYVKWMSEPPDRDGLYKYSLVTQTRTLISADVGGAEVVLGSDRAEAHIFTADGGHLRILAGGRSTVVSAVSADTYQLSPDGSKVLAVRTRRQGFIDEVGIYDVQRGAYHVITPQLAGLTRFFYDSNIAGFTDTSLGIEGFLDESAHSSTYWTFDLASGKWARVFTTDKGLLISKYPGELSFLTRTMNAIQGNESQVKYFLDPPFAASNVLTGNSGVTDQAFMNLLFVGWLPH